MKVKGIKLMQMIMSGEIKDGTKIKVIFGSYRPVYIFRNNCLYEKNEESQEMGVSILLSGHDFEILEDKTEEIEEIQNFTCLTKGNNGEIIKLLNELSICYGEKINELAREINQIKKDLKPLAIGVDYRNDCDKETNCMTD